MKVRRLMVMLILALTLLGAARVASADGDVTNPRADPGILNVINPRADPGVL